jgi:nitrite reductase/ring-hydroxylating ferredoxin subunit
VLRDTKLTTGAEYGLGPSKFPRGWFAVASAAELGAQPLGIRHFGKDFVLYRAEDGRPVMLDAYCPHMGTHLASGAKGATARHGALISGDSIRCPLHGWRFGPDGKCKEIPYSSIPAPKQAMLQSYLMREHMGLILTWYDEEGGTPSYDPVPFPEWDDAQWLRSPIVPMGILDVHPAELVDHHVDKVHYINTHGVVGVEAFVTHFDGLRMSQRGTNTQDFGPAGLVQVPTISDYRGCGIMLTRMGGPAPMVVFFAHTPVEDGNIKAWFGVALRSANGTPSDSDAAMVQAMLTGMDDAFAEDMDILTAKRPTLSAKQIPGDGPFRTVRLWYSQFYKPREEAAAIHARVDGDHATDGPVPQPWALSA